MNEQNRGDTESPFLTPRSAHSNKEPRFSKQQIILGVLLALALATVFLLPRFVTEPWLGGDEAAPVVPAPTSSTVKPSTAAEKTRYRQESQSVLAQIIAVRDRLRERNVTEWADLEFEQALGLIESGDERYSYGEYASALEDFQEALKSLNGLEQQAEDKLAQALADGRQALESLNINTAEGARNLAYMLAPENPDVQALAERVAKLPELAALMERGDVARDQGRLDEARKAYEEAVALDGAFQRARDELVAIRGGITDSRFRQHMSRGYAALEKGDFDAAGAAFDEAAKIRPGDAAIAQARAQLANRDEQATVTRKLAEAQSLEAREQWGEAMAIYESLLAEDPSLADARARLVPVRVRAQLDASLENLTEDPLKLAGQKSYNTARQVLADARGIGNPGPRLRGQIDELDRMLKLAVTPVDVVFRSDNATHVTLYRVKDLGQFEQTTLTLKPGRYTVGGRRQGFRDVQVEFTVTGEPLDGPVVVRCEERI